MQSAKVSTFPATENALTITDFSLAAGRSLSSPYTRRPLQMFLPRTSNSGPNHLWFGPHFLVVVGPVSILARNDILLRFRCWEDRVSGAR